MKETTAKKAPKKRKERDLGTPTVIVRYLDETPEQVAQNPDSYTGKYVGMTLKRSRER